MPIFYNGVLSFEGDRITVHRLAKHPDSASIDCTLTWLGSLWSFAATAKCAPSSPSTFVFEAYSWDISKGRPGFQYETPSKLVLSFHEFQDELDVSGIWNEQGDEYTVSGVLTPISAS